MPPPPRASDLWSEGTQNIADLTMVYNYAADKQITAEQIAGDLLPSTGFTAQYDAGNRITNWNRPTATARAQTWDYDNAGNWNSTARTIGNTTTTENRTHSATDQINTIAGNAATHDLKGNLTEYEINGKDYTVEYDLDNRIVKVEVDNDDVEYRYDAFGRRVIRKEGSTNTSLIWWGNSECAEHKHQVGTTVIQNDIMEHPSRLNSVIARAVDGSKFKLQWYHKNYLDHVYAVSDDSGDTLEHYRYTAFGEVTIYDENGAQVTATQIDNHILWNTRRRDEVTGYYMYKFRHYSAELGRWPARDPIGERGGTNLYAFVGNNGINYWDRLGLTKCNFKIIVTRVASGQKVGTLSQITAYCCGKLVFIGVGREPAPGRGTGKYKSKNYPILDGTRRAYLRHDSKYGPDYSKADKYGVYRSPTFQIHGNPSGSRGQNGKPRGSFGAIQFHAIPSKAQIDPNNPNLGRNVRDIATLDASKSRANGGNEGAGCTWVAGRFHCYKGADGNAHLNFEDSLSAIKSLRAAYKKCCPKRGSFDVTHLSDSTKSIPVLLHSNIRKQKNPIIIDGITIRPNAPVSAVPVNR